VCGINAQVADNFKRGFYAEVIEECKVLLRNKQLTSDSKCWVMEHLGISTILNHRSDEDIIYGINIVRAALERTSKRSSDLWNAFGEALKEIKKPACAAECYIAAGDADPQRCQQWNLKAEKCRDAQTTPEDIALARLYFPRRPDQHSVYDIVKKERQKIDAKLYVPRKVGKESTYLHVLRGNGSFVPIIEGSGGGYLLMHRGRGCVIDPGHGFIRNFLQQGYGFGDIHVIIITHGHDDHIMDLPGITSVINKARLGRTIRLYMDETSFQAFRGHYLLETPGLSLQCPLLKKGQHRQIFVDDAYSLHMDVYGTQHKVPIRPSVKTCKCGKVNLVDGVGLRFRLGFPGKKNQFLVMPSDTSWNRSVKDQYLRLKKCDVALLHMGSLERQEEWIETEWHLNQHHFSQHMKLLGVIDFIRSVNPRFVLLGEKGAELQEVWGDIADAIMAAFNGKIEVCATQINTKVFFDGLKVWTIEEQKSKN
jgi:hypothetical protein